MGLFQGKRQRFALVRDDDQMHMVRHQAVTQERELIKLGVLAQQIQIDDTLVIVGENELAGVSSLGDVVRDVNYGDTSHARRTRTISGNVPSVPGFPNIMS